MRNIYIYKYIYICEKYNQALSRISRQIIKLVTFLITNDLQIIKYKGKFISIEYIFHICYSETIYKCVYISTCICLWVNLTHVCF